MRFPFSFRSVFADGPRRASRPVAAALALALAGCVNYAGIHSDSQIAAPTQYATAQSLPAEGAPWPSTDWATQFGDPQLPKLIDEALEGSPSIAEAQARLAKASSYIESSRAGLFPKAGASYSWNRLLLSENLLPPPFGGTWYSENSVLASASWDLDLWGKNRARLAQAVSQSKAADADLQQARVTLAASVASTYNQLAQLYALRDIAQREIDDRNTIRSITNERVTAGLDTNVEQETARGNVATSKTTLSQLDGLIEVVRYQLAALLGKGPDRGLQIAQPALGANAPVALPDNLPADLIARRPDIVAARWQVEAALQGVKEAKAEFFPDVNLSASIGLDALGWGRFLRASSRQIEAGPAIHLPIFDAGALRAQLKGRYADFDADVANYDKTLVNALSQVATQISSIRSSDQQLVDAQQALDASTRAYELAVVRYRAGLVPQIQVLQADDTRLAADQTVTNLAMQRRDQQIALIRALGGGFDAQAVGLAMPPADAAGAAAASAPAAQAVVSAATATEPESASRIPR
ncbi:Outer membrane component of tripartite multidrug resistance system [Caballeronia glathei]|jgi:NodT family efflux transporter outer membrane factor (OMF) lipoprotein|uniref:efflux transporter outer membrane subunit n=1 Tax=Caballeronia glathei TaxID=60547 RepID=UPI0005085EBB|nr:MULTISPECIES: efflux transporter outer membrane subunit [Burkholderiaceae]TCK36419.1 NodT family efflux transporter outer membrane factor (OMF) lipoprotein [Paraburkholderia sp. BL8N3]CDY77263.1 Outer membrane component of tripartite multidrug resistance system [Caballeronia glathei]